MESLQDLARAHGISLYRAAAQLQGGASMKLAQFVGLIERLRRQAQGLPLDRGDRPVLEKSGLIAFYQTEREGQDRIENLRELVNAAAAYLSENSIDRRRSGQRRPVACVSAAAAPRLARLEGDDGGR